MEVDDNDHGRRRQTIEALLNGHQPTDDDLLAMALRLRKSGDHAAALDLMLARWFLTPDDPSGPWNCVATFRDLELPIAAALCRFLTFRLLSQGTEMTHGTDDWSGDALAFAIDELCAHGAQTAAAALLVYVDDSDERDNLRIRIAASAT
jgi:hypothetical protein